MSQAGGSRTGGYAQMLEYVQQRVGGARGAIAILTSGVYAEPNAETAELAAPALGRRNLAIACCLGLLSLSLLLLTEWLFHIPITGVSGAPHYLYQAEAFLQGHWDLAMSPRATDIVVINGKNYIVYPPFPALVMLPFVAVFGLSTSDILITTVSSAINLPLLFLLFEQLRANGLTQRRWLEHVIMSVLLFFGSIGFYLGLGGRMWFTAHIMSMTCTLLSLLLAFRRHYAWSTILLGCAFFSRSTAILGLPFLAFLAWQDARSSGQLERFRASVRLRLPDWSSVPWRRLAVVAGIGAVCLVLFMIRDAIVFGSPLDTGYQTLINQRYPAVKTGPFSITYVPANIIANFFTFPLVTFQGPFDRHPAIDWINHGIAVSVFVTTPLFLFLFVRNRRFEPLRAALWITIGLMVVFVLIFHASGYYQFGARYLFEAYPYAFLLLAVNRMRVDWRFVALGLLGVFINLHGAHQWWATYYH
jgi:hypothetical protein